MNKLNAKGRDEASAHPPETGLRRFLCAIWKQVPVLLILACAFPLLDKFKPEWLKAIDAATLNYVSYFQFWKTKQDNTFETFRGGNWGLETTILTLTPDAYKDFFNRESPVPRERLACLIDQLAQRIGTLKDGSTLPKVWKPVVGIDVDVTTVEQRPGDGKQGKVSTRSAPWPKDVALSGCKESLAKVPRCSFGKTDKIDDGMQCALRKLAEQAIVVAIVYPRTESKPTGAIGASASKRKPDDARALRNQFIEKICACTEPGCAPNIHAADADHIYFASPHLMYPPLDMVYDFPSKLKEPNGQPEAEALPALPQKFPGLGQAMAAALRLHALGRNVQSKQPMTDADRAAQAEADRPDQALLSHYCLGVRDHSTSTLLDDLLFDPKWQYRLPGAYEFEPIALGRVKPMVVPFDVEPPRVVSGLSRDIESALDGMPLTDVYVLSVDSGTTEDKFQVPTMRRLQSGGWLHGAIAATLFTADSKREKDVAKHERNQYLHHVGIDVACGLGLILCCAPLLVWHDRMPGPVSSHVVQLVWPALAAVVIIVGYVRLEVAPTFLNGEWVNPVPMLLGLLVHLYLDQPEHSGGDAQSAPGTAFETAHQFFWQTIGAALMIGSFAVGGWPEASKMSDSGWVARAAGLLLVSAVVYVTLARLRLFRFLPLTWRMKCNSGH